MYKIYAERKGFLSQNAKEHFFFVAADHLKGPESSRRRVGVTPPVMGNSSESGQRHADSADGIRVVRIEEDVDILALLPVDQHAVVLYA